VTFRADGPQRAITALRSGFFLVVSRLIEHKNIAAVIDAMRRLPNEQLVIVGEGPAARALDEQAPPNVRFLGRVEDDELHWLYANCRALVSASREDFGLTPVEAGMFGKPSALLRFGGFLDTMVEGDTAVFFDEPDGVQIAAAVRTLLSHSWDSDAIVANANRYSEDRFAQRLRDVVAEELDA
jgi:glycosyltransferase involved in cell wall biosynthesis